ncbi:MAG: ABC transporter permease [Bacteroidota bacterium]
MIKNYLKIAWRNLSKNRFISFINLFGLTVGLTCCLLILTYILHELSYDTYNKKADQIYRVTRDFKNGDGVVTLHLGSVAPPFGPLLKNEFPDIQKVTSLLKTGTAPLRYGDKKFNEKDVYFADEHLPDVFDITVVKGNPKQALRDPYSIMLSEEMAKKYFGDADPLEKSIRYDNQFEFKVTGVYKAFPSNAHLHPSMLVSFKTLRDSTIYGEENLRTNWGNNSFLTYLLLPKNYPYKSMEAGFPAFIDKYMRFPGAPADFKYSKGTSLYLQKLTDIHLTSHLDYEAEENGDIKRVYVFSVIALFILLIACINYMNLSTARSALRAKEIGVRKAIGARKKELIAQFLSESVLISIASGVIAILLTVLLLPWLNKVSGSSMSLNILLRPAIVLSIFFVPIIVGILSGLYPALFMSSFQAVKVLKGSLKIAGSNISFRKALVVTQFGISIILIICTAVVFQQLNYMQTRSLGFNRDHIITLSYNNALSPQYESFRNELMAQSFITNTSRSSRIPTGRLLDAMGASTISGDSLTPVKADIKFLSADQEFIPTYGVKMVAGRNFSRDYGTDTASFIVNEAAVSVLGIRNVKDAIGNELSYGGTKGRIIGVMGDFHFESMHQKIVPLIMLLPQPDQSDNYNRLSVKVSGTNIPAAISTIEKAWRKYLPEAPFDYTFLDENFEKLYQAETRQATIFTSFAFIAIFIACLGLFGLSAFAISQRIKEIGIRKVLGASVQSIVTLLSRDFLLLVGIASIISFPIAWYAMRGWLQDFAYRVDIAWWIFILAALIAGIIAVATISIQAIKAAIANPVKSLRNE